MLLLQIIGSVILIFCFASGLHPIDTCSDEYKEDFSCFFQQVHYFKDVKFCTLNSFTCLVNHPNDFSQNCSKNQANPENDWQCYIKDLKPMSYSFQPNQTDFIIPEGGTLIFEVIYEGSNPKPFSKFQLEIDSKNETYLINNQSQYGPEIYSFPIENFGTYSLKIFQPAYQDYDEWVFNITQGHYYIHSKSNLNSNNEVENLICSFHFVFHPFPF